MYYVYILLLVNDMLYTGLTNDLRRRIGEHHNGKVKSTQNRRPLKLLHYEAYLEKQDAEARERFLKTGDGRRIIRKQIRHVLENTHP